VQESSTLGTSLIDELSRGHVDAATGLVSSPTRSAREALKREDEPRLRLDGLQRCPAIDSPHVPSLPGLAHTSHDIAG
jgi:hypothetical protein